MELGIYPDAKYVETKERTTFLDLLPKGGRICELGVDKGKFADPFCTVLRPKEYIGIDVWWTLFPDISNISSVKLPTDECIACHGNVESGGYKEYMQALSGMYRRFQAIRSYEKTCTRLSKFPQARLIVGDSVNVLPTFPDKYFDVIYIDSSHEYDKTLKEFDLCFLKTKDTGIICGHDYWKEYPVVMQVVNQVARTQDVWKFVWRDNWGQFIFRKGKGKI